MCYICVHSSLPHGAFQFCFFGSANLWIQSVLLLCCSNIFDINKDKIIWSVDKVTRCFKRLECNAWTNSKAFNRDHVSSCIIHGSKVRATIPGGPEITEQSIQSIFQDFALINSYFFTLLDRASIFHYNNTKINKFGWKLFILWDISYGLSFSWFARFPEFWGTMTNLWQIPKMTVDKKLLIN